MTRQLSLRRAFWLGYKRGVSHALAKTQAKVDCWEADFIALQDDFETLVNEVRSVRDAQAVREALAEREDTWLLH